MTYYGRWTYKFEEAARQGAAGALIIHETAPAAYGWDVVRGAWTGPQFDLVRDGGNMERAAVEGWISSERANELFRSAGHDLEALSAAAAQPGFSAVPLNLTASVSLDIALEQSVSRNVLALLPGTDRADEIVVYMGHWDHFGTSDDPSLADPIFNGAKDNATGTAGLVEVARAFASLEERPSRSVLFLAVTAEEQGLLGSAYYAAYPVYPTNRTVAALNMDVLNIDGPMNDIVVVGYGNSELDDYADEVAAEQGRRVQPDPEPEKGFYYRSDHFSFAKVGVPALNADPGIDHVEHGEAWTMARRADYNANRYHKPSDEFDESWDWRGAVDDLRLLFEIGRRLATSEAFPNWSEGTEFRAIRDADLAGAP
jgi:Zn-dependent M28 family amino/carboxypeptidase